MGSAPLSSIVRLLVKRFRYGSLLFAVLAAFGHAHAGEIDFSGKWTIDLRTPAERAAKVECGSADFTLLQVGSRISGDHTFSIPGCGRINEGGAGTVKGIVVGSTAVLVVTSGRNGAVVLGSAVLKGGALHWTTLEEISPGDPVGDSPLILGEGVLGRAKD